jgi:CO/xanthine dehydrogenase Mo-binding subunit
MDQVAKAVGLAPDEFRRRNFLKQGDTTATGQVIRDPIDLAGMMDRVLAQAGYHQKQARFKVENNRGPVKRGLGFAAFMHGAGFTGSGERYLNSLVGIEATAEGNARILVSSTEFGQGTNTILCQIAAEALKCEYDDVEIARPDTSHVPNSGPTVASRTAMIVGKLVESAARSLRQTLSAAGFLSAEAEPSEFRSACRAYVARFGQTKAFSRYEPPPNVFWDDATYRGEAYPAYAWAVHVAEVSVDIDTYVPTVENFYSIQEVGTVIHPVLAAGQIEGGIVQGIGYALLENVVWQNGRMANSQMTNYIIPTAADIPPIHVAFEELPCSHGAFGAKGIGELPMDGPAPAILNAIEAATGVSFNAVPLMPEDVFHGLTRENRP